MVYGIHPRHRVDTNGRGNTFIDLAITVKETVAALKVHADEFDSIAVTGVSGLVVGAPVALALKVPLLVLRKEDEDSHGYGGELIGRGDAGERVLFLDDFVSYGKTRNRVCAAVAKTTGARVVGQYTYRDSDGAEDMWRAYSDEELLVFVIEGRRERDAQN